MTSNYTYLRSAFTALGLFSLSACGGGGGGGTVAPPPPPPPTQYGTLAITQNSAEVVGIAVAIAEGTLSIAQTAANEVVVFSTSSGVAFRDCSFGGTASIAHNDADASFSVSAGDTLTVIYDECFGELVDGEMTGTVEIAITNYMADDTMASLTAAVDIVGTLRIADRVDPLVFSDVAAGFDMTFSLDPSETLTVSSAATDQLSLVVSGTTEAISDFTLSRVTRATFPGAQSHEVNMDIDFEFVLDSGLFGGTVTCQTDTLFTYVQGNIGAANVLCRGQDASGVRTSGQDLVSIDPEGDGTYSALGTIDWNQVVFGFLNEPSGLNLGDLFGQIATRTISLAPTDTFYDAARDRLLVTTKAVDAFSPNALVSLSLAQGTQTVLLTFANEPSAVALSADGTVMYVGFTDRDEIRKYDVTTLQLQSTVNIVSNDIASNQYGVLDLAVSPTASNTVAATFNYVGTAVDDVTIFVDDVQLAGRFRNAPGGNSSAGEKLFFAADGSRIHSYYQPPPANTGARDMVVDATGIAEAIPGTRFGLDLELAGDSLYSNGFEYDADTYVKLGSYGGGSRHIAVDSTNRRFFSESFDQLEVWELDRRLPIATYDLGLAFDSVRSMEMAGDYLVFVRDNDLRLLDTTVVAANAVEECAPTPSLTTESDAFMQYACDVIDALYNPAADRIYAAVSADVAGNGNSIAVINPNTELVENYIPVPSNPKRLALSADSTRLYVAFAEAEVLVAIDTNSQTVAGTWQTGVITPRTGYNSLDPRLILQLATSPLEPDTVVAIVAEAFNSIEKEFIAFRDGNPLADELPVSALQSNNSNPYARPLFDGLGGLYALHYDNSDPYLETLTLSATGLSSTGTWFTATSAVWWPLEVAVKASEVYFASGDVANIGNQTVERRFDYNDVPFIEVNAPQAVLADPASEDVWFLTQSNFDRTGLVRFNNADGSLTGADEFPFRFWGRSGDFSHASIFTVGTEKIGMVIDEREGVFVVDKTAIE